jgi:hypothetical protein
MVKTAARTETLINDALSNQLLEWNPAFFVKAISSRNEGTRIGRGVDGSPQRIRLNWRKIQARSIIQGGPASRR